MGNLTVFRDGTPVDLGLTGPKWLTVAERALLRDNRLHRYHAAHLSDIEAGGHQDFVAGGYAEPVLTGVLPTWSSTAGPDGQPALIAGSSDGQMFRSAAQGFPVGGAFSGDWTVAMVAKAGTSAASVAFGVEGNAGGAIGVQLRTTDICRVVTYDAAGALTVRASGTALSANFHLIVVTYKEVGNTLTLFVDGTEVATAVYDFAYGASRYTLFGAYDDGAAGDLATTYMDDGIIASAAIFTADADTNADLMALIEAAAASRYPSLGL